MRCDRLVNLYLFYEQENSILTARVSDISHASTDEIGETELAKLATMSAITVTSWVKPGELDLVAESGDRNRPWLDNRSKTRFGQTDNHSRARLPVYRQG